MTRTSRLFRRPFSPNPAPAMLFSLFLRRIFSGALFLSAFGAAHAQPQTQVPYQRILNARTDAANWTTFGGNYSSHRHSTLTQITPANVANLKPLWAYQQADTTKWEVTPIVVDGIMFISERPNIVTALDIRTG